MTVKIAWFHLRNSKGVVDVEWEPAEKGTTVIGGKSGQGKTCILDNIAWLLGGDRYKPDKAQRDGSASYPDLDITLDNGLRVTRKGKRSSLKVVDTNKKLGNQSMLNEFVGAFALDISKFLRLNGKDKAEALLNIVPDIRDELRRLDALHDELYTDREAHGRVTIQKEKYAAELPLYKGVREEEISLGEIVAEIQGIDKANAANAEQRRTLESMDCGIGDDKDNIAGMTERFAEDELELARIIAKLEQQTSEKRRNLIGMTDDNKKAIADETALMLSHKSEYDAQKALTAKLIDQPTDALQQQLDDCEETNSRVRANAEKKAATAEAAQYKNEREIKTGKIEDVRGQRIALLNNADLPLKPLLTIVSAELMYDGMPWDSMATSDQMKVAAAIAARENPNCGFILPDGLETMDVETLAKFDEWATDNDMQVIGTRVSVGDECSLIIQDGAVLDAGKV